MSFIADKIVMDGLTYDDVLLIPAYSEVLPKTVELSTKFSRNIELKVPFVPAAMGLYALIKKDQPMLKDAVYIGTSVIEAVGITYAAKHIIGRDRPFVKYPDKIHAYGAPDADSPSFPSGHTAAAFSLATSLSITYPKWYVIAPSAVWACGVGFARMNQGVHYPSDVVTGAAIGVGCAFANIYVNRWLNKVLFGRQIK